MPDATDFRADEETLWLTFLAPHRIKLRDIAPVESGMGQFWRSRYGVSWPGLVLANATESDGGFLCSLWLQLTRDRANRASPPFVSDFAAVIHRVTTALRAGALPAAEDCRPLTPCRCWSIRQDRSRNRQSHQCGRGRTTGFARFFMQCRRSASGSERVSWSTVLPCPAPHRWWTSPCEGASGAFCAGPTKP